VFLVANRTRGGGEGCSVAGEKGFHRNDLTVVGLRGGESLSGENNSGKGGRTLSCSGSGILVRSERRTAGKKGKKRVSAKAVMDSEAKRGGEKEGTSFSSRKGERRSKRLQHADKKKKGPVFRPVVEEGKEGTYLFMRKRERDQARCWGGEDEKMLET